MEVINSNEENAREGDKEMNKVGHVRFAIKPVLAVCIISLFLAGIIFLVSFNSKSNPATPENMRDKIADTPESKQDNEPASFGVFFADCKPLQESCPSGNDCISASICGEGVYETCEIYDCGDTYGVYTKSGAGGVNMYKQEKTDKGAKQSEQVACKGLMLEALQQKCVDNKMQLKVKLTTEGECKISDFIVLYGGQENQPNTFVSLGNNVYSIEIETCGDITEITPRTEGGIAIL